MLPPATTEASALNRLAHARVCWALEAAGIDHLVIKGVSTADLLQMERPSGDVDVLVAPADVDRAVEALDPLGYTDPLEGSVLGEGSPHSRTLRAENASEVDVHRHFPGVEGNPAHTWAVLRQRADRLRTGGREVAVLDSLGRVLVLSLAAARDGRGSRAARDLEAALERVEAPDLRSLAEELGALGPLKGGISTLDARAEMWERRLELDQVVVPDRWRVLAEGASGPDRKWQELRDASWPQRARILWREFWPTRAFIEFTDPRAGEGTVARISARFRRWQRLASQVPQAIRRTRRMRRPT